MELEELQSLYNKDISFTKDEAAVSLVQKGIHGFLFIELALKDKNGLRRVLHMCEFNPKKGGRGIPKTFQTGEVTIAEINIDDDERALEEYANTSIIVLQCWKIPRRSTETNLSADDNSADQLIENIRQNVDSPKEIVLTDSQTEMFRNLETVNEEKATSTGNSIDSCIDTKHGTQNDAKKEKNKTGRRGFCMKFFGLKSSKAPVYSVSGNSTESSIDTEHGIQNCFTYAVYMLSTIGIAVGTEVKSIYLKNCARFKLQLRTGG